MRPPVLLIALTLLASGCLAPAPAALEDAGAALASPLGLPAFATDATGAAVPLPSALPVIRALTLEYAGAEPTLGVTSNGHVFFAAMEKVLRSTDGGVTWDVISTPASSPTTLDPYLYVDPDTDRVYSDQLYLGCSWLSWSDDYGETWTTNPAACGLPVNDHQKIVSAVNRGPVPTMGYDKVLFYGYNAIAAGSRVSISYDGGITWPVNSETVSPREGACNGGLHGNLIADAEGILYLPKRHCEGFILAKSVDSGLSWTTTRVGADAGGSECRKNADLAVDRDGHVYGVWPGADNHLYLSTSRDQGESWLEKSLRVTPAEVNMTSMPAIVAGDAGRIAIAYYGTADGARGPDEVDEAAHWHLYVTYSLDALGSDPTFVTMQVSEDPVQIGGVSTNSGCAAPPGSRNLLDFIDAQVDLDGRLHVAYADGCVKDCVESLEMGDSRSRLGSYARLVEGPSLFADIGTLSETKAADA